MNPPIDHLQTEAKEQLEFLGYKDGDTAFYRGIKDKESQSRKVQGIFPSVPCELSKLSADGFNIYLVVNGGGDKDADVTEGKAIFYEHDDLAKEEQIYLWQSLNLPEPTFQIDTGGKSIHSYYVLDRPIDVAIWRTLQTDLINYSDADKANKNPSRVMRLAGYKHQKTGELSAIVSRSGKTYTFESLRDVIPVAAPKPEKILKPKAERVIKPRTEPNQAKAGAIPLENCLAKSNRELMGGVSTPGRDDAGATLARDLIGTANYLNSIEQPYIGDAHDLFDRFAGACSPPIGLGEDDNPDDPDRIWRSAEGDNPSPSCQFEGVDNILTAWNAKNSPVTEEDKRRCPYFESSPAGGLWRVSLTKDDAADGYDDESAPMKKKRERIGNHLKCVAYVNNPDGNGAGLQLELLSIRGRLVNWTMKRGYIVSETGLMLSELLNIGYQFKLDKKKYLIEYLNSLGADVEKTFTVVDSTGWVNGRYISQHKTYGEGDYVFQQIESSSEAATEIKGTLADWKTHVGSKCDNNSRLIFVIGVAFAAPLLDVVGLESGGFHLMGDTSTGKTTAVKVAVSVTGEKVIPNWRTTANALEITTTAHNHSVLALDEIGQADDKGVGETCYMLRNEQGKSRSTKDLKARKVKTWRLLFLSTGEHSLMSYMAMAGKVHKGGQEVGMPDIPAVPFGSPYGAFESIHGCDSSKEFAENLEAACKKYRGTAIDEFLTRLVVDRQDPAFDGMIAERVFKAAKKLAEGTTDLAVSRVANRFAVVQIASELAHSYNILPFGFDRIEWAVKKMFGDWLTQRGGDGSIEVKSACDRIRHLIASNLHSDRMYDLKDRNVTQKVRNLLGYVESDEQDAVTEVRIPIPIFDAEICQGVNKAQLIAELQKRGWLAPNANDDRPTHQRKFKGKNSRYYIFLTPSFQDSEKTMDTLDTLDTLSETESGISFQNDYAVSKDKNGLDILDTFLRENAVSSDFAPNDEIDPDILTS